jgi:hypothetical protein
MFVTELSPNIISNAFTAVGSKLLKNSDYRQCSSLFATSPLVIHFHRWLLDESTYIVPISWVFVKQLKVQKFNILDYQHQRSRIQYISFHSRKEWALWTLSLYLREMVRLQLNFSPYHWFRDLCTFSLPLQEHKVFVRKCYEKIKLNKSGKFGSLIPSICCVPIHLAYNRPWMGTIWNAYWFPPGYLLTIIYVKFLSYINHWTPTILPHSLSRRTW